MTDFFSFPFFAMGTECVLHLYAQRSAVAEDVAQAVMAEVSRIEQRYSRFRPDSFLSEINRVAEQGGMLDVDEETAGLLNYASACHEKSAGLFDISAGNLYQAWDFSVNRLPVQDQIDALLPLVGLQKVLWTAPRLQFPLPGMKLDFGGIGKEYAADRVADVCVNNGISSGLIDLGGDLRIIGPHPDGSPWRIGIRDPAQPETALAVVDVREGAMASSGDYERYIEVAGKRYGHILNPTSGWPVQGLSSVSVIAPTCLVAGSISTMAMLKGREAPAWLKGLGISHGWVDDTGQRGGNLFSA
ncbi:FAD:protein FMN transferase [Rhodoferax sp.]|uniref:FAD:protein FMN transferase n=1 Tax=Rhodoferax sp. TaxID=50421 RepID=UPI0028483165|nr:FAD:protein FMN transferase [Rhodoferax sp.]MDR3371706.1 FAD:protein FMN transferase [Rhodoferax sp.]